MMENHIKEAKRQLLKGELKNFEFTNDMKMKVLEEIDSSSKRSKIRQCTKNVVPIVLSAALITMFFAGVYTLVQNNGSENPIANHSDKDTVEELGDKNLPAEEEKNPHPDDNQEETEENVVEQENEEIENEESIIEQQIEDVENSTPVKIEKPDVIAILTYFDTKDRSLTENDQFVEGSEFKYKNYSTKQELFNELTDLASMEVIEFIYQRLLVERPDGLYLLPQDSTFKFDPNVEYTIQEKSDAEYLFSQYNEFSNSNIEITLEYINNKWIITKYSSKPAS